MGILKYILKTVGFIILFLSLTVWFIIEMDNKSLLAIPALILTFALPVLYLYIVKVKKCPKCGLKSRPTGISGDKYAQWYCKSCEDTFWTDKISEDYE